MFHIDKVFLHPNIGITVRFTPILYDWLKSVCERENITFNHLVLQCCKNCMEMDMEETKAGGLKNGTVKDEGDTPDRDL